MSLRTALPVAALLLAGCSGTDPGPGADLGVPTPEPVDAISRCLPDITEDDPATATSFEPEPGVSMPGVVWGEGGGTVLVLLHQTNRDGMCGWTPFARHVAAAGLSAIAFDMCSWASSDCPEEWSLRSSDQVAHVVEQARSEYAATRVVLVGASMGGARTVYAVADGVDVDAWVDVSGPPGWDDRDTLEHEAARIDVPGMVLHDPRDGTQEYAASRRTARAAGAEFVRAHGGHGYDVLVDYTGRLTRFGRQVLDFAAGEPS